MKIKKERLQQLILQEMADVFDLSGAKLHAANLDPVKFQGKNVGRNNLDLIKTVSDRFPDAKLNPEDEHLETIQEMVEEMIEEGLTFDDVRALFNAAIDLVESNFFDDKEET